jgi:hypothetical protein
MFAGEAMVVYQNLAVGSAVVDLRNESRALVCIKCIEAAGSEDWLTLVLITRSLRFQPNFLMALPMRISDCPAE